MTDHLDITTQGRAALRAAIDERLGHASEQDWLTAASERGLGELDGALGEAHRAVGTKHLIGAFSARDSATLPTPWGAMGVGRWRLDTAARIWLLAGAAQREAAPYKALFELYDRSGTPTRMACLHAINFIVDPDPAGALEMIADAGRTYLEELMDAAWCDNPFATAHMTIEQFRKAVLKALFCDVDVSRFLRLEERADADLAASLCEFADEREAAGRPVPDTVWIVAARHQRPGLIARLLGRMEHPLPAVRLVAAKALCSAGDPRTASFIEERLGREENAEIRATLEAALVAAQSAA